MTTKRKRNSNSARGFSLVEIMITTSIVVVLSIGTTAFMINVGEGYFWAANKSKISKDVRLFSMELAQEARASNAAYIYESFKADDRNEAADRKQSGQTGDCLVLVNTEPYPNADDPRHVTDIVVYFRKPDADGTGSVYRYEHAFAPADYVDTTEDGFSVEKTLLSVAPTQAGDHPVVVELSKGLADGRLFKNRFNGRLVVVNGEILHGNTIKEITNTYNLSIAPRG